MRLKCPYFFWRVVVLGVGIMIYVMLGANSASVARHFSAQPQAISVVNRSRPTEVALEILQDRHGAVITYEDAPYIHEMDVDDDTSPEWRQAHPNGLRALIPNGHCLGIGQVRSGCFYESLRGFLRSMRWRNDNLNIPAEAIQKGHEADGRETAETSREP